MKIEILKEGVHNHHIEKIKGKNIDVCDPITSTTIYIEGKKKYVVDPGSRVYSKDILKSLKKIKVKPEQINYVINTHSHMDHIENNFLFKNAIIVYGSTFWFQTKGRCESYHDHKKLPFDEIKIIPTPGHKPDHQSVIIKKDGKTIVIAGDAVVEFAIKENKMTDEAKETALKLLDMADILIPGHGKAIQGKKIEELKRLLK